MDFTKDLSGFFDEITETVSIEDLTKKVESSILQVLRTSHKDTRKHRFHKRAKSIQFSCPVCGDSSTDSGKMRGHIYLSYGLYKCYNDSNCTCSVTEFFAKFGLDNLFTNAELQEMKKIAVNSRAEFYQTRQAVSFTEIEDVAPNLFDKKEIMDMFEAVDMSDDPYITKKIAHRQIPSHKMRHLLWCQRDQCMLILNMHYQTEKVMSFQKRNMKLGYKGPKYMTVSYSDLLAIKYKLRTAWRNPEDLIELSTIAGVSGIPEETIKRYDITCQYFNIMNVDWGDDIYIFEGPIDSFFMPNSLAFSGTGADLKHPTFHYIFDDDKPGRKEASKRLDNREPVFMWKKFYYDFPIYRKPYMDKTDFNDLYIIKPFTPELIRQYFTDNPLNKLNV